MPTAWTLPAPGPVRMRGPAPAAAVALEAPGPTALRGARPAAPVLVIPRPPAPVGISTRAAEFAGDGLLSVVVLPVLVIAGDFTGEGTLSATGVPRIPLPAEFGSAGVLSVDVQVVGEPVDVAAPFTGEGTLTVSAVARIGPRGAALAAEGTLSVVGLPRHFADAALSGDGALSVSIAPRFALPAPFAGDGALSALTLPRHARTGDLGGAGALTVTAYPRHTRLAGLSGEGSLSVAITLKTDVTDNFNRADGPLGANWVTSALGDDTTVVPRVVSNQFRAPATLTNNQNNQCAAIYVGTSCTTDDMAVRATMTAGENGLYMGPIVRANSTHTSDVMALITSAAGTTGIYSRINGTLTRRTTSATTAYAAGDVFELRAQGNVYTLIRNPGTGESTISTWTDSGNLFPVGPGQRQGGLYHNSDRNLFGTQNNAPPLDDFRMRDL